MGEYCMVMSCGLPSWSWCRVGSGRPWWVAAVRWGDGGVGGPRAWPRPRWQGEGASHPPHPRPRLPGRISLQAHTVYTTHKSPQCSVWEIRRVTKEELSICTGTYTFNSHLNLQPFI